MATCYISEFNVVGGTGNYPIQAAQQPPIADQIVSITAGALLSNPFSAHTMLVRIETDSVCSFLFGLPGSSPSATTSNARMAANQTEYFNVQPGGVVSVIANT